MMATVPDKSSERDQTYPIGSPGWRQKQKILADQRNRQRMLEQQRQEAVDKRLLQREEVPLPSGDTATRNPVDEKPVTYEPEEPSLKSADTATQSPFIKDLGRGQLFTETNNWLQKEKPINPITILEGTKLALNQPDKLKEVAINDPEAMSVLHGLSKGAAIMQMHIMQHPMIALTGKAPAIEYKNYTISALNNSDICVINKGGKGIRVFGTPEEAIEYIEHLSKEPSDGVIGEKSNEQPETFLGDYDNQANQDMNTEEGAKAIRKIAEILSPISNKIQNYSDWRYNINEKVFGKKLAQTVPKAKFGFGLSPLPGLGTMRMYYNAEFDTLPSDDAIFTANPTGEISSDVNGDSEISIGGGMSINAGSLSFTYSEEDGDFGAVLMEDEHMAVECHVGASHERSFIFDGPQSLYIEVSMIDKGSPGKRNGSSFTYGVDMNLDKAAIKGAVVGAIALGALSFSLYPMAIELIHKIQDLPVPIPGGVSAY